jgi:Icc-related predicted phosphoesterase
VPVLYIMGNDDLVELDSRSPRVQPLHARRVTCERFSFIGYQYSLLDPGFGETRIGSGSLRGFLERNPFLAHVHGHSHAGLGVVGNTST